MNIAFITVNFNNAGLTEKLLASLLPQCDATAAVIVVDNHSEHDDAAHLRAATIHRPHCALIPLETNGGFAAGCNVGIRAALADGADWIVLINNDTHVADGFVRMLRQKLDELTLAEQTGIAAIPLVEHDRTAYCGLVEWLAPELHHTDNIQRCRAALASGKGYVIGGGAAIHRTVFERIGFLDERYFLYFEDADFSRRAWRVKIPLTVLDQPVIIHAVSASTKQLGSPRLLTLHYRNALLYNWHVGPWWVKLTVVQWAFMLLIWHGIKVVFRPALRAPSKAILRGIAYFFSRRFGSVI